MALLLLGIFYVLFSGDEGEQDGIDECDVLFWLLDADDVVRKVMTCVELVHFAIL